MFTKSKLMGYSSMTDCSILWQRLIQPGHESARLSFHETAWHLGGTAVFAHDEKPCRLDYQVRCDSNWRTMSGRVGGWLGNQSIEIEITIDSARCWWVNGKKCPAVTGCLDLDLNFSPSTNLLPIRRLGLTVGQEAGVKAAWLRFPGFTLEPLNQIYRRVTAESYQYESAGGRFTAELTVNTAGLVTDYPNFWKLEATS